MPKSVIKPVEEKNIQLSNKNKKNNLWGKKSEEIGDILYHQNWQRKMTV